MKMLQRLPILILPWLCLVAIIACKRASTSGEDIQEEENGSTGPLTVMTTFYPTQYFAQRIAGDLAEVTCPIPEDADPIFWMPDATTIQRYQKADLIVLNGAGFEKWIEVVSLPQSAVTDTAKNLTEAFISYENAAVHQHGPEGEHTHEGIDGHTWLDPNNAKAQSRAILEALLTKLPGHQKQLNEAYQSLADELDQLDADFKALKLPPMLCSHPAYNYLARRYSWTIHNLDLDPDSPLSKEAMANMRDVLSSFPASHLLWESEPLEATSKQLSNELALQSLTISPCELLSSTEQSAGHDYLKVMKANLVALQAIGIK